MENLIIKRLADLDFELIGDTYIKKLPIVDGQLTMEIKIFEDEKLSARVIDNATDEEYILHLTSQAQGAFVGRVRAEYEAVLEEINQKCFNAGVFKTRQANELIKYAAEKYGDEPEFLWKKFDDNAVLRRKDTQKWYAALLSVQGCKIGLDTDEKVEVIDLRVKPEELAALLEKSGYFPGYHMNKKSWYTILLDGTVNTEEIFKKIDESYALAKK